MAETSKSAGHYMDSAGHYMAPSRAATSGAANVPADCAVARKGCAGTMSDISATIFVATPFRRPRWGEMREGRNPGTLWE